MSDTEWPNRKPFEIADEHIQEIHRLRNALEQSIETVKSLQSTIDKYRKALEGIRDWPQAPYENLINEAMQEVAAEALDES